MTEITPFRDRYARRERLLLGAIVRGADLDEARAAGIQASNFLDPGARTIFECLASLDDNGSLMGGIRRRTQVRHALVEMGHDGVADLVDAYAAEADLADVGPFLAPMLGSIRAASIGSTARDLYAAAEREDLDAAESMIDHLIDGGSTLEELPVAWGEEMDDQPPPQWMVNGLLEAGTTMVIGPYGVGKSFVAASLAIAIQSGEPWMGLPVQQRNVLYVAAEGKAGMIERLRATAHAMGVGRDHIGIVSGVRLSQPSEVARLRTLIRRKQVGLLIIDTWSRVLGGIDENSTGESAGAVAMLDRIRERFDCAMMVVHHTGKQGDDSRGSTTLPGASDSILTIKKSNGGLVIKNSKQKNAMEHPDLPVKIKSYGGSGILVAGSFNGKDDAKPKTHNEKRADALALIRKNGHMLRAIVEQDYGPVICDELVNHPDCFEHVDASGRVFLVSVGAPLPGQAQQEPVF